MEFMREKRKLLNFFLNNRRQVFTRKKYAEMGGKSNNDNGHLTYGFQGGDK